jgi:hypothetical protein
MTKQIPWPRRPDGTKMTMGEMTPWQRREQLAASAKRFQKRMDDPRVKEQIATILGEEVKP